MGEDVNTSARRAYIALGVVLATFAAVAYAATFQYFSPATGILKGNASSYVTTAAVSSDVRSLWTGTCSASTFLRGDGACVATSGGTVSSVALTMPSGFSVGGSPVTTSGTLAVSTTLNGLLKGNGSGFTTAASADVIGLWTGTCSSTTFLRGDGSCTTPGGGGTVTSVALTVPSFLSISGSPVTTSGTLAVSLSGTALPVLNGGTGTTTSTGTGNVVLSASPTLTGTVTAATVAATSVTVGGNAVCQSTGTNCPAGATVSTGSFTTTWDDACTTSPTTTWNYISVDNGAGKMVTLFPTSTSGFPCTSDSTTFSETGASVPAAIRQTNTRQASQLQINAQDSGTGVMASYLMSSTGNLSLTKYAAGSATSSPWTASGNKSPPVQMPFTYYTTN